MSDNPDLKSKILLMRQKNFGEVINESSEKNDNKKLENSEIQEDEDEPSKINELNRNFR